MAFPASDPKETLIGVEDVSFQYGHHDVLKDVTLSIKTGDFLAIIGPNGSGKTTLLKIILGLLKPSKGKVCIMGKSLEEFDDWKRIGYIPQKATHVDPFFPVSVKEVVAMGLLSGKKNPPFLKREDEVAIDKALNHVGMAGFRDRRMGKLSGGQQQRVFIARAVVNLPHILFLDEPTTGVDLETQEHFYDLLDNLNKTGGITIVLVTHEIGIINRHVSQVACLNQSLVYHGTHEGFCQSQVFKNMLAHGHHLVNHKH